MNIKISLIMIITFHGFFLAILLSIGQLIISWRSIKSWLLIDLFIVFALFQINYILYELNMLDQYKIGHIFSITAYYLMGPLIYLITKQSIIKGYRITLKIFFHFLPVIIVSILATLIIIYEQKQTTKFISGYFYNEYMLYLSASGSLYFLVYLGLAVKVLIRYTFLSKHTIRNNPQALIVFILLCSFLIAWISDLLAFVTNLKVFIEISILIITLILIFLFLVYFKYPDYHKKIYEIAENEKKRRSYLNGVNLKEIDDKLNKLIEFEEIYADPSISLPTLAVKLNISQHQLSQFLNDYRKTNFSTFINKYRIQKAKELLVNKLDHTILGIAFDVGFQSKSTFNSAFIKYENITPHEYREKMSPKL